MAVSREVDWSGVGWEDWSDLAEIRARLDAGADPHAELWYEGPPLHVAAEHGSPEVIAELARRVDDVDAEHEGRSALWRAVFADRADNALALVAAGADPWRPMMGGWSPGRLSLAGPTPGLFFPFPPGRPVLSEAEMAAVVEAERLIDVLGDVEYEGLGLAFAGAVTAAEVARRLEATVTERADIEMLLDQPWDEQSMSVVGVTEVPGGCVVSQRWGHRPADADVVTRLSAGTACFGMFANPKNGDQGIGCRDGVIEEWGVLPGGSRMDRDEPAERVLAGYLYQGQTVAFSCAYAGLRPIDARSIQGPPDLWLRLPLRRGTSGQTVR
ncbi:MAG: ankyrin repeat domain-containing protein [Nonomuraea sp.]|nr:ankyrin repeat domain-containing protein [Nonomuraea sp.]